MGGATIGALCLDAAGSSVGIGSCGNTSKHVVGGGTRVITRTRARRANGEIGTAIRSGGVLPRLMVTEEGRGDGGGGGSVRNGWHLVEGGHEVVLALLVVAVVAAVVRVSVVVARRR